MSQHIWKNTHTAYLSRQTQSIRMTGSKLSLMREEPTGVTGHSELLSFMTQIWTSGYWWGVSVMVAFGCNRATACCYCLLARALSSALDIYQRCVRTKYQPPGYMQRSLWLSNQKKLIKHWNTMRLSSISIKRVAFNSASHKPLCVS